MRGIPRRSRDERVRMTSWSISIRWWQQSLSKSWSSQLCKRYSFISWTHHQSGPEQRRQQCQGQRWGGRASSLQGIGWGFIDKSRTSRFEVPRVHACKDTATGPLRLQFGWRKATWAYVSLVNVLLEGKYPKHGSLPFIVMEEELINYVKIGIIPKLW